MLQTLFTVGRTTLFTPVDNLNRLCVSTSAGLTLWQKWHMPVAPSFWGPCALFLRKNENAGSENACPRNGFITKMELRKPHTHTAPNCTIKFSVCKKWLQFPKCFVENDSALYCKFCFVSSAAVRYWSWPTRISRPPLLSTSFWSNLSVSYGQDLKSLKQKARNSVNATITAKTLDACASEITVTMSQGQLLN